MNLKLILSSVIFLHLTSCKKEVATSAENTSNLVVSQSFLKEGKTKIFKGPEVNFGNGKARSIITLNELNQPLKLTIEMNNAALRGLPTIQTEYILPLHEKAKETTPFKHIAVNWNPNGHEPMHVYDVPHFDFHFYTMNLQDRLAIPLYSNTSAAAFDHLPPSGYMPATYIPTPGGVPQMGKHWIDVTAPEFNGQHFSKTFIYGSYNGQVTFLEPMVTLAVIQSGINSQTNIASPNLFAPQNTYYPTVYRIEADESSHFVSLAEFRLR